MVKNGDAAHNTHSLSLLLLFYLFEDFRHFYDMDDNKKAPIRNGRMSDICAPAAAVHYFCCFQTTSHVQSTVNVGWWRMEMAKNSIVKDSKVIETFRPLS